MTLTRTGIAGSLGGKVRSAMEAQGSDVGGITAASFHTHPGVGDWRVTSTGPQAVFRAVSIAHAAQLVPAIVAEADRLGVEPDVDVRPEAVIIRVPYRNADSIPASAPEFAAVVSAAAASLGLRADVSRIQTVDIAVAQHPDADTGRAGPRRRRAARGRLARTRLVDHRVAGEPRHRHRRVDRHLRVSAFFAPRLREAGGTRLPAWPPAATRSRCFGRPPASWPSS